MYLWEAHDLVNDASGDRSCRCGQVRSGVSTLKCLLCSCGNVGKVRCVVKGQVCTREGDNFSQLLQGYKIIFINYFEAGTSSTSDTVT